jgi:predicted transcriptional regulator of viral defense system
MKFEELLRIARQSPIIRTGLLLVGDVDPAYLRLQLSRWVSEGKLVKLRRGVYTLADPYSTSPVHPYVLANAIEAASYVSCQSALAWYGLIPEHVVSVTSVTSARTGKRVNSQGSFIYRHVQPDLMFGFSDVDVDKNESARVALPEKALLDLVYLEPHADSVAYLRQLRLQNMEMMDMDRLFQVAGEMGKPKLIRACENLVQILGEEEQNER